MDKINQKRTKVMISANIIFSVLITLFVAAFLYLWGRARLVDGFYLFLIIYFLLAFIILVSVPLLFYLFYRKKHEVLIFKNEKKYFVILSIILSVASVISITGIEIKHYDLRTYTREKWLVRGYDRGRMIHSFMKQVDLVEKDVEAVIYYLGEPDYQSTPHGEDEFAYRYNYNLGSYLDFIDPPTFEVSFNETNIVSAALIRYH